MIKVALILALVAAPIAPERLAVMKGEPAPADGVWLSLPEVGRIVSSCKEAENERDNLKKVVLEQRDEGWSTAALAVGAGFGVAIGVALGIILIRK